MNMTRRNFLATTAALPLAVALPEKTDMSRLLTVGEVGPELFVPDERLFVVWGNRSRCSRREEVFLRCPDMRSSEYFTTKNTSPISYGRMTDRRRHDAKRRATQPSRRWYKTKAWASIKERRKAADPLCRKCLLVGRNTLTTIVDHIKPHRGDRALFFCYENTQGLCKTCHDSDKQQEEALGYSTAIDPETGWPIDERHPANASS